MSKSPATAPQSSAPSLQDLRKEIDRIDEAMHGLLMERGEIIDRLISVKKTQEVGSAFRPAREADMMRRLVERHKGMLPLDTVESIWRVIISTFTYVQAPFSMHADLSAGDSAMRDSARFHFGFSVPFVPHFSAVAAVEALAQVEGRSGAGAGHRQPRRRGGRRSSRQRAEDHRPAAVPRACRSSGGLAGVRDLARRRRCDGHRSRDVLASASSGWSADVARAVVAARRDRRGAGHAPSTGPPCSPRSPRRTAWTRLQIALGQGRRLGALDGPRRQPCEPLYRGAGWRPRR